MTPGRLSFCRAGGDHLSWAEWPRNEECELPLTESTHPYFMRRAPSGFEVNLRGFFPEEKRKKRPLRPIAACCRSVCWFEAQRHLRVRRPSLFGWKQLSEGQFSQGFVGNIYDFFLMVQAWGNVLRLWSNTSVSRLWILYVHSVRWRSVSFHRILGRHVLPIYLKCFICHCSPLHFHFGLSV